jgi:hypothetical protein
MLDDPDSLLGRLQRGRGDAVRELLRMPVETARETLVRCLCTDGDLCVHDEGYAELVMALSPDLSPWYQWIDNLAPDVAEETLIYAFNTLGQLAVRGHEGARGFLRRHVLEGRHWQSALGQYLRDDLELDRDAWAMLLPRLDEETLQLHISGELESSVWSELAASDGRVAAILHAKREKRAWRDAASSWSCSNYADAAASQRRWRVLLSLIEQDPTAAVPFLIDGLWDGSYLYRNGCIERCDLAWPGVRARLSELAKMAGSRSAEAARKRLDSST